MLRSPGGRLVAALGAAVLLAGGGVLTANAQQEPPRTGGQYWFGRYGCSACHGGRTEGTEIAPPIAGRADGPFTYDRILKQVRTPLALMPDFPPEVLPDDRVQAIADYIATFEPPR
jgi:mono/diheme cytochrome c family protein